MNKPHGARHAPHNAWPLAGLALLLGCFLALAGCSAQPQAVSSSVPPADSSVTASFSVPPAAPLPEKEDWRVLCLLGGLDDERNVELARGVQDGFTRLGIAVVMDDSYAPRLAEGEPMLEDGQPLPAITQRKGISRCASSEQAVSRAGMPTLP